MVDIKLYLAHLCYWLCKIGKQLHELKPSWEIFRFQLCSEKLSESTLGRGFYKLTKDHIGICQGLTELQAHIFAYAKKITWIKKIAFVHTDWYLAKSIKY